MSARLAGLLMACLPLAALAQSGPPPAPVSVAPAQRASVVPSVPVTGTVYSRNEIQVTLGVDGRLEYVAEPGTVIRRGEVLARIDTAPLALQRAEQQAQAERAAAQLRFLDAQLRRQRDLASDYSISANQLEQNEADRDVAASDLRIAELRIRQIDEQLERAVVRAQFDGVVVERLRREGEDISRGTVVGRVTDTGHLEVRAFAPLRYAGRIRPGARLRMFGFESEFEGTVRAVVPSADVRSQTFELRIDLPGSTGGTWSIGQLVSVAIPVDAGGESVAVPRDALILRQDGEYVFRVAGDGTAQRVRVSTGDSAGDLVAVSGELSAGECVVVRGAETLTDGGRVEVVDGTCGAGTRLAREQPAGPQA